MDKSGYAVGPYGGTLNEKAAAFYCVDYKHDIYANTGWTVTNTTLPSASGYGNIYQANETIYLKMAWLVSQMLAASDKTLQDQYQSAIWYLSVEGNLTLVRDPYGTDLH